MWRCGAPPRSSPRHCPPSRSPRLSVAGTRGPPARDRSRWPRPRSRPCAQGDRCVRGGWCRPASHRTDGRHCRCSDRHRSRRGWVDGARRGRAWTCRNRRSRNADTRPSPGAATPVPGTARACGGGSLPAASVRPRPPQGPRAPARGQAPTPGGGRERASSDARSEADDGGSGANGAGARWRGSGRTWPFLCRPGFRSCREDSRPTSGAGLNGRAGPHPAVFGRPPAGSDARARSRRRSGVRRGPPQARPRTGQPHRLDRG